MGDYDRKPKPKDMSSLALAYLGDAVIELHVRERLLSSGIAKPNGLHREAIRYVSAKAQAEFLFDLLDKGFLSEDEQKVVRRGRNAKSASIPKNTDVQTYRYGTAFEALIGHIYLLDDQARLYELLNQLMVYHSYKNANNLEEQGGT